MKNFCSYKELGGEKLDQVLLIEKNTAPSLYDTVPISSILKIKTIKLSSLFSYADLFFLSGYK